LHRTRTFAIARHMHHEVDPLENMPRDRGGSELAGAGE
jgi:hypothetical protein